MPININEYNAVKIPHHCFVKLQASYDSLKTAEKKAADLLLEKPEFFGRATIIEAAEAAGCSEATLVRLARRLGYGGYPELKAAIGRGDDSSPVKLYQEISTEDSCGEVIKKVFKASIQALEDTLEVLDKSEYEKAVASICACRKLLLYGVGDAAAVARSGFQKFFRVGLDVQAPEDMDVQLISLSRMSRGDVMIAISYSGRTRSVVDVVKYAKSQGITVIAITNYPVSPLAKNSDYILLTAAFTEHVKGEVISKRVAELCILESLFVNVLLKCRDDKVESLEQSNTALEINKI